MAVATTTGLYHAAAINSNALMPQSGMASSNATSFDRHRRAVAARLAQAQIRRPNPDSVVWTINKETIVIAGWGRAILLQFAHPLIAAGVHDHSRSRGGPLQALRRLSATVGAMLSLTFGNNDEALDAAAAINTIHDRVAGQLPGAVGVVPAGTMYSAHDPELLRWVHATLLQSIPLAYELLVGPLGKEERDRYCAESAVAELLFGMPEGWLPRDTTELETYMSTMMASGRIAVSDTSRALADALLFPRWSPCLWPAFRVLRLVTIGSLPPMIRDAYGYPWRARDERAFARWTAWLRRFYRYMPRRVREWPAARRRQSEAARDRHPTFA